MPKVTFLDAKGNEATVEGATGSSVMQAAMDNMITGIVGDCGGNCSCATCHGYVDAPWDTRVPPPSEDEASMLEGALYVEPTSRLTCQLMLTDDLDGLVVRLPISQT